MSSSTKQFAMALAASLMTLLAAGMLLAQEADRKGEAIRDNSRAPETLRRGDALTPVSAYQKMAPEEVVAEIYSKLERLIRASGADVIIEISNTAIWSSEQFGTLQWASIAEYPEEGSINVTRFRKTHADGRVSINYKAAWARGDGVWFYMAEHLRNDPRSVALVIEEAGTVDLDISSIDTLVTFEVVVQLEGLSKRYSAAMFFWYDENGLSRLRPVDYVLQGVDRAATENPTLLTDEVIVVDPPGRPDQVIDSVLGDDWQRPASAVAKSSTCSDYSTPRTSTMSKKGTNSHISGHHIVEAQFLLLSDSEVISIDLQTIKSERQDRHGNQLRYASHVHFSSGPEQRLAAIDVFFVTQDEP